MSKSFTLDRPQPGWPEGQHLVLLMAGYHSGLRIYSVGDHYVPFGGGYHEVILAVPYVRERSTGDGPFWALIKLYLDSPRAIGAGLYYGFNKHLGRFTGSMLDLEVINFPRRVVSRHQAHTLEKGSQWQRQYETMFQLVEQPMITQRKSGRINCSRFYWDWDETKTAPVEGNWTIGEDYSSALQGDYAFGEAAEGNSIGMEFDVRWLLSHPARCSSF